MMLDPGLAITAFVTMFVILDPIGTTTIFVALTQGQSAAMRRRIALRACFIGYVILFLFAFFGEPLLGFIGITMPAFRIAGGILLFLTALEMLFQKRTQRRSEQTKDDSVDDPSVFPLAVPLLAGPGGIASVILLAEQAPDMLNLGLVLVVTALVLLMAFGLFLLAGPIEKGLGKTGVLVVTRLLGMLLAALSVQFVLDGLRDYGLVA